MASHLHCVQNLYSVDWSSVTNSICIGTNKVFLIQILKKKTDLCKCQNQCNFGNTDATTLSPLCLFLFSHLFSRTLVSSSHWKLVDGIVICIIDIIINILLVNLSKKKSKQNNHFQENIDIFVALIYDLQITFYDIFQNNCTTYNGIFLFIENVFIESLQYIVL